MLWLVEDAIAVMAIGLITLGILESGEEDSPRTSSSDHDTLSS